MAGFSIEPYVKLKWEPPANPEMMVGYASAYAPEVMEEVVRFRLENRLWRHVPP